MNIEKMQEMIDRYLQGTATPREKELIEKWLQDRQEDHQSLDKRRKQAIASSLWQSIAQKTNGGSFTSTETKGRSYQMANYRLWIRYAAAIIIMLAAGAWLFTAWQKKQPSLAQTITAPLGSDKIALLPDSSIAHLFPGATLTISNDFNKKERSIALTGRVFFEVKHNPSRPFYVQSGHLRTRVLGTSFEVMAQDSNHASVIVRTGKVGVQYGGQHLADLTPGKRLRYDVHQQNFVIDEVNAAMICEWWNNGMVFSQAPLGEVAQMLANWYNVPIEITNTRWKQETVTIRIKNQSLGEALSLLSETLGFQYRKEKNRVIIF